MIRRLPLVLLAALFVLLVIFVLTQTDVHGRAAAIRVGAFVWLVIVGLMGLYFLVKRGFSWKLVASGALGLHLRWLAIGSPLAIVALCLVGLAFLVKHREPKVLLIAASTVVPLAVMIVLNSTLLNALRHFMFVVPGMILLAVWGLMRLFGKVVNPDFSIWVVRDSNPVYARPHYRLIHNVMVQGTVLCQVYARPDLPS